MHPGHILALQQAMRISFQFSSFSGLYVGLQTSITDRPEKNQPIQTVYERYVQLDAILSSAGGRGYKILPYESEADLLNILNTLPRPYMRCLGSEYWGQAYTGQVEGIRTHEYAYNDLINSSELETTFHADAEHICYLPRAHSWSTSSLRKKIEDNPVKRTPLT
jgi:hypothetical protein